VPQLEFAGNPTMATSDSWVIYEVVGESPSSLRRTIDGGATWKALPLPFQEVSGIPLNTSFVNRAPMPGSRNSTRLDADSALLSGYPNIVQFLVSPLDPNVVWLQTNYRPLLPANCVALIPGLTSTQPGKARTINALDAQLPLTTLSGTVAPPCIVQFFSNDGGQHWAQTAPTSVFTLGRIDPPPIWAQGQRLYAKAYVNALSTPATATYLMTSLDGGATWTDASAGISDPICDARPAPTGSTVFAITDTSNDCFSGSQIWRSDDAGKDWVPVSHLNLFEEQMYVAVSSDQTTPIVYLFAATTHTEVTTLQVSLDRGATWSPTPMPNNQSNLLGALQGYTALTSDGRLIAAFSADDSVNDGMLYSWKVGDSQWSPVSPPPQTTATTWAIFFLATPSSTGESDALWYVANPTGFTMEFYHLQL
jgi:hypothetical protein